MPGNLAELRPLIFICAFIGLAVLLVGWMVTESPTLFLGADAGSSSTGSSSQNPLSLMAWNETYILNITDTLTYTFKVGGWNVHVEKCEDTKGFFMETYDYWWIFYWNYDAFRWFKDGVDITHEYGELMKERIDLTQLDSDFAEGKSLGYDAKNSRTQFFVTFAFNTTKYELPTDAFDGDEMHMIFNIDWDDRNTNINALSFIAGLFTFSVPGAPIYVSAIIWLMLFPPLAYLTFIFVLKILGAIFGGG